MANHSSNFKILASVELDTKDIQAQLNAKTQKLKIDVDSSGAQELGLNFQEANMIMRESFEIIGDMVDQVYDLNGAITEFRKVSDLDGGALDAYVDKLADLGMTVGRTGSEMVDAATMFRKNSFNDQDSAQLARVAAEFQNVSDTSISAADSASFIISQMKAFNIAASDVEGIIDRVNEVANNFSVGTNDLSNALELSASGMQTYNNTIEQTIGLVTAGTEIMVGRSSQVARGLNTIAANIVKNEDALKKYGVEVSGANGALRSTFDILSDLKPAWDRMSDSERVALGQTLAGKNQYRVLAAIMGNFETATSAAATALDASGSAARENAKYMESLEAKTNQLKATFQDLANNVINSELVGSLLNLANNGLKLLNTPLGTAITQFVLLTGAFGGVGIIVGTVLPKIIGAVKTFGTMIAYIAGGAGTIGEVVGLFGGFASVAVPVAAAIAAIIVAVIGLKKAYDNAHQSVEELTRAIEDDNEQLETNKKRLEEIAKIPAGDRTGEIEAETERLKAQNTQLERNILLNADRLASAKQDVTVGGQFAYKTLELDEISGTYHEVNRYAASLEEAKEAIYSMSNAYETIGKSADDYRQTITYVADVQSMTATEAAKTYSDALNDVVTSMFNGTEASERNTVIVNENMSSIENLVNAYQILKNNGQDLTQEQQDLLNNFNAMKFAQSDLASAFSIVNGQIQVNTNVLFSEANQAKYSADMLNQLRLAVANASNARLNASQVISMLAGIFAAANDATSAISATALAAANFSIAGAREGLINTGTPAQRRAAMAAGLNARSLIPGQSSAPSVSSYLNNDYVGGGGGSYSGGNIGGGGSSSSSKPTEAQIQLQRIQDEIDKVNDKYDKELSTLEEQNKQLEDQLSLEKKLADLAEAREKKHMVFVGGKYQYVSDYDAISAAQSAVDAEMRSQRVANQKSAIESRRDAELAGLKAQQDYWRKQQRGYATGTTRALGGLAMVGENGPELRVLNSGDGIIPSEITKNLWQWGSMNPKQFASMANGNSGGDIYISDITLPSVTNAEQFVSGIKRLAYQRAYKRA